MLLNFLNFGRKRKIRKSSDKLIRLFYLLNEQLNNEYRLALSFSTTLYIIRVWDNQPVLSVSCFDEPAELILNTAVEWFPLIPIVAEIKQILGGSVMVLEKPLAFDFEKNMIVEGKDAQSIIVENSNIRNVLN